MAGQSAGVPGRSRGGAHAVRMVGLTAVAMGLAWGAWQGAAWAQGMLGLDWLGMVFPAGVLALALTAMSRVLGEGH